jgi:Tfp pilus assembly protein PilO
MGGGGNGDDIVVKAWARQAVIAVVALIVAVFGVVTTLDSRFVIKREHEEHEKNDREEVARIDATLLKHIGDTRMEAVRLSVIEAQLGSIQRQLEIMDGKLDRAARTRNAGLVR